MLSVHIAPRKIIFLHIDHSADMTFPLFSFLSQLVGIKGSAKPGIIFCVGGPFIFRMEKLWLGILLYHY
jgi:hypothetical protein